MERKTRVRGPNFTVSDNMLLLDIVEKFMHIIENKKTDGANLKQKQSAWIEVAKMYNATTSEYTRTSDSLHHNYKNLKKKAKKNASDAKVVIPGKRKLDIETPSKQTVSDKFKKLANVKMELVEIQLELLKTQVEDEKEKLEHNRMLRAMEIDEVKKKYDHNEKLRKLELEKLL